VRVRGVCSGCGASDASTREPSIRQENVAATRSELWTTRNALVAVVYSIVLDLSDSPKLVAWFLLTNCLASAPTLTVRRTSIAAD
jgi:hypothetical protein